jgi:hypothetical protein
MTRKRFTIDDDTYGTQHITVPDEIDDEYTSEDLSEYIFTEDEYYED